MNTLDKENETLSEFGGVELPPDGYIEGEWDEDSEEEHAELEDGPSPEFVEDDPDA